MKQINMWEDEEVKSLFKFVEVKKSEGVPLIKIFKQFGDKVCRRQNSVRNYYYKEIKQMQKNPKRAKNLQINLCNHLAKTPEHFSKDQTAEVVNNIKDLLKEGYSVRGACLKLSHGDATKMVRLQNKYRSEVKYKNEQTNTSNIIKMPVKKEVLAENDITALFLGLVKLVKKQAEIKASESVQKELITSSQKLKTAILEIATKQVKIEKLKNEIALLNKKIQKMQEQDTIKTIKIAKYSAHDALRGFLRLKEKANSGVLK